jgi:hypothetical protein
MSSTMRRDERKSTARRRFTVTLATADPDLVAKIARIVANPSLWTAAERSRLQRAVSAVSRASSDRVRGP